MRVSIDRRSSVRPVRLALLLLCLAFALRGAPGNAAQLPQITIIIDDMGNRREPGLRVVALPGPVACAFLPHTPHAAELAELAHRERKEVILHIPMESHSGRRLGPGGVTAVLDRIDLIRVVSADLRSIPHVSGVSNHMGSLLTPRREAMGWLMDLLRVRGNLFFVDSRTTRLSSALEVAQQRGVPSTWRDVFLDNDVDEEAISRAFERLLSIARRRGTALAIGHPHDETLAVLARMIPRLDALGVRLVPVASLIRARESLRPPYSTASRFRAAREFSPGTDNRQVYFRGGVHQSLSLGHAASTR